MTATNKSVSAIILSQCFLISAILDLFCADSVISLSFVEPLQLAKYLSLVLNPQSFAEDTNCLSPEDASCLRSTVSS